MKCQICLCLRARGSSRNIFRRARRFQICFCQRAGGNSCKHVLNSFLNKNPLSLKMYGKKSPDYDGVIHEQNVEFKQVPRHHRRMEASRYGVRLGGI